MVVKVWDKASKNFAIKAVNKGGQYKAVAQEGRLRMAFTVTALFADTSPESLMALLLRQNPGLPSGALLFVSRVRSSGGPGSRSLRMCGESKLYHFKCAGKSFYLNSTIDVVTLFSGLIRV